MKISSTLVLILLWGLLSTQAMACPKGQHPYGGTGSHHKGGYCSY